MIRIVDRAWAICPMITPTLFVDDLSAEMAAPEVRIIEEMGKCIRIIAEGILEAGMVMSDTKSVCSASTSQLANTLCKGWKEDDDIHILVQQNVKSLGAGLGAGRRRNTAVQRKRLGAFKRRVPKFRRLVKLGIKADRVVRTGGLAGMTFGQAITGVSNSTLLRQRQVIGAATAPAGGSGGQDLDVALMLADGSAKGKADPAFPAHAMPIKSWAEAVWMQRLPRSSMKRMINFEKKKLRKAARQWSVCCGPAAAFVATCNRLLWKVVDESTVVTDLGRTISFELDPPKAVKMEVDEAVRRWRWRRIVKHDGDVDADIAGRGAFMEPIWKLLRSRQNDDEWNPVLRGSLRSALANRQYPQCRVKAAGWSMHDKCLCCLNSNIEDSLSCGAMRDRCKEIAKEGKAKSSRRDLAGEATGEILAATPKGTLGHRIYECPRLSGSRDKHADKDVVSRGIANPGTLDYERAMKQRPPIPSTKQCKEATFEWEVKPVCGWFEGTVYPDGSLRDGKFAELARSGWSFVVIDDKGRIVAAANGVPPGWIVDIGGAEAWAIYQAARFAVPGGCRYISDSLTTVRALQAGIGACTAAGKKYARVYRLCSEELDGTPPEMLIWMPAHKTKGQAARCLMSNGEVLTETHRDANDRADVLAKKAVEVHRVRKEEYELWVQTYEETQTAAK